MNKHGYVFVRWHKGAVGTWLNYGFYSTEDGFVEDVNDATFIAEDDFLDFVVTIPVHSRSVYYYAFDRVKMEERVVTKQVISPDFKAR